MSNKIKGLTIEIGGETTALNKALGEVNKHSRDLKSELRDVERLLKLDPGNTELLSQKQKILAESIENTKSKLDTLKEAEKQAQDQFKQGKIGEEQYRAIQREVIKTEEELKKMNKQLQEMDWKGITDGLDKFGKKSTEVGKDISKKVTVPVLGIGIAATKVGMDFEQSMSEVQAISGATGEELEQLEGIAREMGSKTSKSAKDAADALKYMALAGWDVETSMKGLEPVLRLSEAGNIDLGRASDLVTDSMSAMGIQVEDLNDYLDKVAKTQASANTSADGMLEAYVKAGGMFKNLNTDLDTSAALLGVLANRGIKASEAGTGLNSVLVNLSGSTQKSWEVFEELGIALYDSEGKYRGVETVLFDLKDRFGELTEEQQNFYMTEIAGKSQIDTMAALLDGLGNEYNDLKNDIENAEGSLITMAETMQDNNKGSLVELSSALEELGLKIYDVLKPAISSLIEFVQGLVDWLNNLSPEMQQTIVIVAGLAAAIGPLLIVIGQMSLGISGLIKLFAPMIAGLGGATGATGGLSAVIGALTGPIGIAIAAIVAITAVVVTLWKTNEDFRDGMKKVWDSIKQIIDGAAKLIKGIIQTFIGLVTGDWTKFTDGLKNIWSGMWQVIKNVVDGAWNLLSTAFNALKSNITNFFTDMVGDAVGWGKNLISGFIDGIKSMVGAVGNAVSGVVGKVKDFIGFNSPTKEGEGRNIVKWGYNMIDGFMEGMNKAIPELQTSMASVIPELGISTSSNTNNTSLSNSFVVHAVIREEQDIKKVAKELHNLQQQKSRGRGIK